MFDFYLVQKKTKDEFRINYNHRRDCGQALVCVVVLWLDFSLQGLKMNFDFTHGRCQLKTLVKHGVTHGSAVFWQLSLIHRVRSVTWLRLWALFLYFRPNLEEFFFSVHRHFISQELGLHKMMVRLFQSCPRRNCQRSLTAALYPIIGHSVTAETKCCD